MNLPLTLTPGKFVKIIVSSDTDLARKENAIKAFKDLKLLLPEEYSEKVMEFFRVCDPKDGIILAPEIIPLFPKPSEAFCEKLLTVARERSEYLEYSAILISLAWKNCASGENDSIAVGTNEEIEKKKTKTEIKEKCLALLRELVPKNIMFFPYIYKHDTYMTRDYLYGEYIPSNGKAMTEKAEMFWKALLNCDDLSVLRIFSSEIAHDGSFAASIFGVYRPTHIIISLVELSLSQKIDKETGENLQAFLSRMKIPPRGESLAIWLKNNKDSFSAVDHYINLCLSVTDYDEYLVGISEMISTMVEDFDDKETRDILLSRKKELYDVIFNPKIPDAARSLAIDLYLITEKYDDSCPTLFLKIVDDKNNFNSGAMKRNLILCFRDYSSNKTIYEYLADQLNSRVNSRSTRAWSADGLAKSDKTYIGKKKLANMIYAFLKEQKPFFVEKMDVPIENTVRSLARLIERNYGRDLNAWRQAIDAMPDDPPGEEKKKK